MKNRIKKALAEMGIEEKKIFTIGELEEIASRAKCPMYEVMKYLRNR